MCRPTDFLPASRATPNNLQPRGLASLIAKIGCANVSLHHAGAAAVISKGSSTTTMESITTASFSSAGPVTRRRSLKRTQGTITPENHDDVPTSHQAAVSQGSSGVAAATTDEHHDKSSSSPALTSKRDRRRRQCSGGTRGHHNDHHHHDRTFVQHSYHDHAQEEPETTDYISHHHLKEKRSCSGGGSGTSLPFPMVLHNILDDAESEGYADAISWQPHGRAFLVHNQEKFVTQVMPRFFRQTRFSSFQRQLSLYGFLRLTRKGADSGAYYNEYFLRGKPLLCRKMSRTRIKGYWVRQSSSPETEPDFYQLLPVGGGGDSSPDATGSSVQQHYPATAGDNNNLIINNNNMETEEPAAEANIDYDPLPLSAAFPAPWTVPMNCQVVTAALGEAETRHHHYHHHRPLPPMPPLSSYRPDILDCSNCNFSKGREDPKDLLNFLSVAKIPPPVAPEEMGISPEDQEALAEFLSDVDLSSEDADDEAYHGEQEMENIYVHAARI